jgi:hypothetical protein
MNFRRNKPRLRTVKTGWSRNSWRKRNGLVVKQGVFPYGPEDWNTYKSMMSSNPAWWDRMHHTRPWRAKSDRVTRMVMKGYDPDELAWPVNHKPHIYYW